MNLTAAFIFNDLILQLEVSARKREKQILK
jgi:hypothetical protein